MSDQERENEENQRENQPPQERDERERRSPDEGDLPDSRQVEHARQAAGGLNQVINALEGEVQQLLTKTERGEVFTADDARKVADNQQKIQELRTQLDQQRFLETQRADKLEGMSAAELKRYAESPTLDQALKRYLDQLIQHREQQEYYAAMNPLRTAQLQPHWTPEQQKEWFHHQMKLLLETRKGPGVAENEVLWQLIKSSTAILQKSPELKEEYEALMTFYEHFSVLTSATRLEPIVEHASHIKAVDMSRMLNQPLVARAVRLLEEHNSYKEFLGADTPKDKNGRLLGSMINLGGPSLDLRRLALSGEMAKEKLAYELARKYTNEHEIKDKHGRGFKDPEFEFKPSRELLDQMRDQVNRSLDLNFLDKFKHEKPEDLDAEATEEEKREHAAHEAAWNIKDATEAVEIERGKMVDKIQKFIEQAGLNNDEYIPESFFTKEGENMEQVLMKGTQNPDQRRRNRGESVFEEAQLGLYSGESIWRTFERAAFFDGENPNAITPEGGGENPLRRLLHQRKYAQELLKDGKIKHADYHIVEHLVNPTRDFLSDGSDSFWKNQTEAVQKWHQKMIDTPGKIDKYGRFTDMSECPFEEIDFRGYQDIPDRSPLYPHYSNFLELAEELRKQEELKPGALLETPTMENYVNFVKLYRNLRSEDVAENRANRAKQEKAYKEGKGRKPLPSREEASYELFRGLMSFWKDNRVMDDESITNAILSIADAYQESFITPKYRDKLLREHLGKFWGTWPMWEVKQTWGKIDWGAGFMGLVKGLFKGIGGK